jgi:hypothetical protein
MPNRIKKLPPSEALVGEVIAFLLAIQLSLSFSCSSLLLEGDSLLSILAIKKGQLFSKWLSALMIADSRQLLNVFND